MRIDIYDTQYHVEAAGSSYCSLFVKQGTNPNDVVPADVLAKLGKLTFTKTDELSPADSRVALDSKEAVSKLEEKGYYVACAEIKFTISTEAAR